MIDKRKLRIILPTVAVAAFGVAIITVFISQPSTAPPPLPNPNGYDDFVKAAALNPGQGIQISLVRDKDLPQLVATNQEALKLVRVGLTKQCRVPVTYDQEYLRSRTHTLVSTKDLAQIIRAEGRIAELHGGTNEAARIYLEGIHFGKEACRGGVLIDRLVGNACEAVNLSPLEKIVSKLDSNTCRELLVQLQTIEKNYEPIEDTIEQERRWAKGNSGFRTRLASLINYRSERLVLQRSAAKIQATHREERMLLLDLAARAYELDNGRAVTNANQLVPAYLKSVPIDPETGAPLRISPK